VLLVGETGVGKEVYARAVHATSGRTGRFVAVNCAALPNELIESELFGYARGAHSQATQAKRGLIEEAEGGTLFLDEIGDMGHSAQAKLLRFLQTRELLPLGATRARAVDVRILAATSQYQPNDGSKGLRGDLVGRMGAAAIELPPLRARREDVGALVAAFQRKTGVVRPLDAELFAQLLRYDWPRNVRELEKVIETAALLAAGAPELTLDHVPDEVAGRRAVRAVEATLPAAPPPVRRRSPRPVPTREELERALREHGGNVAEVARALDRQWRVVKDALKAHGIDPAAFKR
jgi:transcriptional regulator with PAS, ATPase and Fis domain